MHDAALLIIGVCLAIMLVGLLWQIFDHMTHGLCIALAALAVSGCTPFRWDDGRRDHVSGHIVAPTFDQQTHTITIVTNRAGATP